MEEIEKTDSALFYENLQKFTKNLEKVSRDYKNADYILQDIKGLITTQLFCFNDDINSYYLKWGKYNDKKEYRIMAEIVPVDDNIDKISKSLAECNVTIKFKLYPYFCTFMGLVYKEFNEIFKNLEKDLK